MNMLKSYRSTYEITEFTKRITNNVSVEALERHGEAPAVAVLKVSYRPTPSINLHQSFLSLSQNKDHGILDIRLFQNPLQRIHRFGR